MSVLWAWVAAEPERSFTPSHHMVPPLGGGASCQRVRQGAPTLGEARSRLPQSWTGRWDQPEPVRRLSGKRPMGFQPALVRVMVVSSAVLLSVQSQA